VGQLEVTAYIRTVTLFVSASIIFLFHLLIIFDEKCVESHAANALEDSSVSFY
jgi:hypothetical protein